MRCDKCNDTGVLLDDELNAIECDCIVKPAEKFIEYAHMADREGVDGLLEYLDESGFYSAPASTRYHLAEPGGLVEHSVNVCNAALTVWEAMESDVPKESVILSALFHDIGKHQYQGKDHYVDNILKSGNVSGAQPYKRSDDILPLPHEITAIHTLSRYIDLTDDEIWAIIHHNGLYSDLRYNLTGKETELQMIIHFADMWASRIMEVR